MGEALTRLGNQHNYGLYTNARSMGNKQEKLEVCVQSHWDQGDVVE